MNSDLNIVPCANILDGNIGFEIGFDFGSMFVFKTDFPCIFYASDKKKTITIYSQLFTYPGSKNITFDLIMNLNDKNVIVLNLFRI